MEYDRRFIGSSWNNLFQNDILSEGKKDLGGQLTNCLKALSTTTKTGILNRNDMIVPVLNSFAGAWPTYPDQSYERDIVPLVTIDMATTYTVEEKKKS